jgi:hypothetical protein
MTIKEIAELCGVEDRAVRDWSKKVNCGENHPSLQNLDTIEESGHGKAADLSVETATAIIRAEAIVRARDSMEAAIESVISAYTAAETALAALRGIFIRSPAEL